MDIQDIINYIKEVGEIEMPDLQEQFALSYSETTKALSELEKKGMIKYRDGFTYDVNVQSTQESVQSSQPKDIQDDDEDDEEDDDDEDDDDEDDDDEYDADEMRERIEQRRKELMERLRRDREERKKAEKAEHDKTEAALREEIEKMSGFNPTDETFSLEMHAAYPDETPFRIKAIDWDGRRYISDCGNTVEYLSKFNDRETLINYFKDTLRTENTRMIENAVCTTLDDIYDLSGEGAFLFKVVNDLVAQKHFSKDDDE